MQRVSIFIGMVLSILLLSMIPKSIYFNKPTIQPISYSNEDIYWMAKNVYHEAGNQQGAGRLAVMHVTMNRVNDGRFGNSIKEVVTQKTGKTCQFSWYCKDSLPYNDKKFLETYEYVKNVLPFLHMIDDITDGALYFHATYVKPYWSKVKQKTIKIGDHIFYKEKDLQ